MKHQTMQVVGLALLFASGRVSAQFSSGSSGIDGALVVSVSTNINMADHPNGIYNYTSVTISNNTTVTFTPNLNNTPVVWLVQSNVVISGTISVNGQTPNGGSVGGPGGYAGGGVGMPGHGPGAGSPQGGHAVSTYLNAFLIPLLGGSGGAGSASYAGGGGGGAILIASSTSIALYGNISACGGDGMFNGGDASGGGVRLVAPTIAGNGTISALGGHQKHGPSLGRVRFDTYLNSSSISSSTNVSEGAQFVVIPPSGQGAQLSIVSVAGVPVSGTPTGILTTPDAVIAAQQANPIPIVVQCSNIPLNTQITVSVTPVSGSPVSATGYNNSGTSTSSTATVQINMPRGGGLLNATAAIGN